MTIAGHPYNCRCPRCKAHDAEDSMTGLGWKNGDRHYDGQPPVDYTETMLAKASTIIGKGTALNAYIMAFRQRVRSRYVRGES